MTVQAMLVQIHQRNTSWLAGLCQLQHRVMHLPLQHELIRSQLPHRQRMAKFGVHSKIPRVLLRLYATAAFKPFQDPTLGRPSQILPDNVKLKPWGVRL